jgi:hypothetical protein
MTSELKLEEKTFQQTLCMEVRKADARVGLQNILNEYLGAGECIQPQKIYEIKFQFHL